MDKDKKILHDLLEQLLVETRTLTNKYSDKIDDNDLYSIYKIINKVEETI